MSRTAEKPELTSQDRNALVARLRASRIAAAWADEVQHSGASTIEDLIAAAESVVQGRVQGGAARHVASIARDVFLAYAQDRGQAGTSRAVPARARDAAADHSVTPHQASLAQGREERLDRRRARAVARHADTMESVDGLLAAFALMGADAVDDPLYRLAQQHVGNGFLLPPEVEGLVRQRVRDGELAALCQDEVDRVRIALLGLAVAGLRRSGRDIAYAMIDRWDRGDRLRTKERQVVESLLWEARNDKV